MLAYAARKNQNNYAAFMLCKKHPNCSERMAGIMDGLLLLRVGRASPSVPLRFEHFPCQQCPSQQQCYSR